MQRSKNQRQEPPGLLASDVTKINRDNNNSSDPRGHSNKRNGGRFPVVAVLVVVSLAALAGAKLYNDGGSFRKIPYHEGGQYLLGTATTIRKEQRQRRQRECRYYVAESAIPRAGLGLYTTIDIGEGEEAQSMKDVCIHMVDPPRGGFSSHSFGGKMFHAKYEGGKPPRLACEGFATLFNNMPDKGNLRTSKLRNDAKHTDNAGLHRGVSPGAGAVTQYYGITSVAARDIKAGSELTFYYGNWEGKKIYEPPTRPVEWIEQEGMCIDNIDIRPATNPEMGRGAFARRAMPKDSVVAPAPLQFYRNRADLAGEGKGGEPEKLFVNYCLQPRGSSMLIYPYGPGVGMINHAGGTNPNVEFRWSTHYMHHSHWLDLPLEQFWEMVYHGGMILDVVALRDIAEGEELFLDYGPEFEAAWNKHVARWAPPGGSKNYVYPADMDTVHEPFRTVEEQRTNPYPKNLLTVCEPNYSKDDLHRDTTRVEWEQRESEHPVRRFLCQILKRDTNRKTKEFRYEVSVDFYRYDPEEEREEKPVVFTGVPQGAISFVERPFASDIHLPNAFRHPIVLDEKLVPKQWRR